MKSSAELPTLLEKYNYALPDFLIATHPSKPRDSAKLLIYIRKTDTVFFDKFYNLDKYLPKNSILVLNDTKVIPARIILRKESGGKIEAMFIRKDYDKIIFLLNKKVDVGTRLFLKKDLSFCVTKTEGKYFYLQPEFEEKKLFEILEKYGNMPIPKYIKGDFNEKKLKKNYQTVFAKTNGSIAAPTASLHFTNRLLTKIKNRGFDCEFVTLHVNEGTFAPIKENNLQNKSLHEEYYYINKSSAEILNHAKRLNRSIIAVGTTVTRTLESAVENGILTKLSGNTKLFIQEEDSLHFTDGLLTNFHLPQSSLMMLVACFVGRKKLLQLYSIAIHNKFRFYSFGDAMLIL